VPAVVDHPGGFCTIRRSCVPLTGVRIAGDVSLLGSPELDAEESPSRFEELRTERSFPRADRGALGTSTTLALWPVRRAIAAAPHELVMLRIRVSQTRSR
jgi:hypothetical protein